MHQRQKTQCRHFSFLAILTLLASILFTQPGFDSYDHPDFSEEDSNSLAQDEALESNQTSVEAGLLPHFLFTRLASVIELKAKQRAILSLAPILPDIVHVTLSERGPPR